MGLEVISIEDLINEVEHEKICIEYEEEDNLYAAQIRIFKSTFSNVGLKKANFVDCSIKNSVFETCYLRYALFNNVDLTGSSFFNCDLSNIKLNSCNIRYVKFNNCKLNVKEVLGCLPQETNLKIQLLKEVRLNQLSIGDNKGADEILIMILDAEKELLLERVRCETSYHQEREDFVSRVKALWSYTLLNLNDLIWGYGLKLSRLFRVAITVIFIFSLLIYFLSESKYISTAINGNISEKLSYWNSLYISYTNFLTLGYGNYIPNSTVTKLIFVTENTLGYIFLGFLVSGVYRRIAK